MQQATSGASSGEGRFAFAPPRHFVLPAVLLLLSEEPSYGYQLVKGLRAFRFGDVDRPAVYRALAQLEKDRLVQSWSAESKAGQARRVYGLTEDGERALRTWMGVVKEERDALDRVLAPLSLERNARRAPRGSHRRMERVRRTSRSQASATMPTRML